MADKVLDILKNRAILYYLLAALIVLLILVIHDFTIGFDKIDWDGIWVEAHGMWFDILIMGVVLSIYDYFRDKSEAQKNEIAQKNQLINEYQEQIYDYREWDEKEAAFRLLGLIRRLNKLGITKIDLRACYFWEAPIKNLNLQAADFRHSNLHGSYIWMTNLSNADFSYADLREIHPIIFKNEKSEDKIVSNFTGAIFYQTKIYKYQIPILIECGASPEELTRAAIEENPPNATFVKDNKK
jgi:uncharacterized protein YjbI with pentapeptide repeats